MVLNLFHYSLIDDIRSERLAKLNMRKSLEQSWDHSVQERQGQLMDEVNHSQQPSILLHQQCEKYHRSEMNQVQSIIYLCGLSDLQFCTSNSHVLTLKSWIDPWKSF